jgi:hypothetical protein
VASYKRRRLNTGQLSRTVLSASTSSDQSLEHGSGRPLAYVVPTSSGAVAKNSSAGI